jgi:hypothetical protein
MSLDAKKSTMLLGEHPLMMYKGNRESAASLVVDSWLRH